MNKSLPLILMAILAGVVLRKIRTTPLILTFTHQIESIAL